MASQPFQNLKKQDEMLGFCLMSSITENMLKHVSRFDTSKDSWTAMEKSYVSKSRARVIQVKEDKARRKTILV